ncbi:MAG: esterase family protein [Gemmataceae bacterium]|nr:esterase family protein [Gemmataceae bacterium]
MSKKSSGPGVKGKSERRTHEGFASRWLGNSRTLTVHLPPGYVRDVARRYPVLYLHDGQNVFDDARAAFGTSWKAGETADRLALEGRIRPAILVGIDNTPDRLDEYGPWPEPSQVAGGRASEHGRFVLEEVKPFIDRTYRTLPGRAHTAVAGSSMGGLASLALARANPDRVGMCAVMSPALWWARGRMLDELEEDSEWMRRVRFWVCMGTREGKGRGHVSTHLERTRRLVELFDGAGLVPGRDYCYWEVAGGRHDEAAWAARFDKVLLYFFGW